MLLAKPEKKNWLGCSCNRIGPITLDWRAHERQSPQERNAFAAVRRASQAYERQLRSLARHVGNLISGYRADDPVQMQEFVGIMERYAQTIEPWAKTQAENMLVDVANRDYQAWMRHSRAMGAGIRKEIESAPTGSVMQALMAEQVTLIKSIPLDAAQRVHQLATESLSTGRRPADIAKEIMRTGEVSKSKATLIARTEVGRASVNLMRSRAEYAGSTHFKWTTVGDASVRPSHKALEGKIFPWSDPPVCDPPDYRALPGGIFNCRCLAVPVFPDD